MLPRRLGPVALVALVLAVSQILAACGLVSASGEGRVRVYSGRHYDLEKAFKQFADRTGIGVRFLFGDNAALRRRLAQEGESTPADNYMTVDVANLALAARQDLFQPLDSRKLRRAIPADLRDPKGRWFGLSMRARTIVYNPDNVEPDNLSTYAALADPRWQGRLCMRNSTNSYTQSLIAFLIHHHGYDRALRIVKGWVANDVEIVNSDIRILDRIGEGECDVGITNHYYLARLIENARQEGEPRPNVRIFWANQSTTGTHVNISGAGVTRYANDPKLSARLIEWLATDGQKAFTYGNHEYPANPRVEPDPIVQSFGEFKRAKLHPYKLAALNDDAVRLMNQAGYE